MKSKLGELASEYDAQRKEALFQRCISAAADCIGAEMLAAMKGRPVPLELRLPDDWRKAAASLAAERLMKQA